MAFIVSIVAIFVLLVGSEIWWRKRGLHDEFSRKFIHITVGSFVAFWPFFLSWDQIRWLSLGFVIAITISKQLNIFKAIHSVQRPTWGELFFGATVGLTTLITHNKWVYLAALLQMSLADGLAAVIGVQFGKRQRYYVFRHPKSVVGTLTFFVVSLVVLLIVNSNSYGAFHDSVAGLAELSLVGALIENLAVLGFDNLAVPLIIAALLKA